MSTSAMRQTGAARQEFVPSKGPNWRRSALPSASRNETLAGAFIERCERGFADLP